MTQTILIYNDLIVTFYEKLNVLNLFMEFFHIFSLLLAIIGGLIILMDGNQLEPRERLNQAEDMYNGPREERNKELSALLQRQFERNLWNNQNRAYDCPNWGPRCRMDYDLKVKLWHIVKNSPVLRLNYRPGSSIGTVYKIRGNDKLVSNREVISVVKFWENR
jgi:hypothetical protein